VPGAAEDYIHRVGRTARAELTGEAFTFVSPEETDDLRQIERAIGKALPRVTLPDFDYAAKPSGKLEIPIAERIAQIRAKKADDRARAKAKLQRSGGGGGGGGQSAPARQGAPTRQGTPSSGPSSDARGSGDAKRRRRRGGGGGGGGGGGSRGPYAD
jgi:ATP-dependent RNA helicase RhlE